MKLISVFSIQKLTAIALIASMGLGLFANGAQAASAAAAMECRMLFNGRESVKLDRDQSVFVTSDGKKIALKITGTPGAETVVIFLPGIDKDMRQWDFVRSRLAKDADPRTYVQIDPLGQGHTAEMTRFRAEIPYQEQMAMLRELIETKGWAGRKIVLVGHSYGGGLAGRFAADHPGLVSDIVLVSPFVDNLEIYQPGVGPVMAATHAWSKFLGLSKIYDLNVGIGSQIATTATWPGYALFNSRMGRIWSVLALTSGVRDLRMTQAIRSLGQTRVHLAVSMFDEMVPTTAQYALWTNVPAANRGRYTQLLSTHDSVTYFPDLIANVVRRAL